MTHSAANSSPTNSFSRCAHRYANGRRCRLYATNANRNFCSLHLRLPQNQPDPIETTAKLAANLDDFTSPEQINTFLSRLLILLAQDKISTRRAAVLAYITNQILRTIAAIARQDHPENTQVINCRGDYCRSHDANLPRNFIINDLIGPDSPSSSEETRPGETRQREASECTTSDTLRQLLPLKKVPA